MKAANDNVQYWKAKEAIYWAKKLGFSIKIKHSRSEEAELRYYSNMEWFFRFEYQFRLKLAKEEWKCIINPSQAAYC